MRSIISVVFVASALTVPAVSFAQAANGSLTRGEVRAQLVVAERHGLMYGHTAPHPQSLSDALSIAARPRRNTATPDMARRLADRHNRATRVRWGRRRGSIPSLMVAIGPTLLHAVAASQLKEPLS